MITVVTYTGKQQTQLRRSLLVVTARNYKSIN